MRVEGLRGMCGALYAAQLHVVPAHPRQLVVRLPVGAARAQVVDAQCAATVGVLHGRVNCFGSCYSSVHHSLHNATPAEHLQAVCGAAVACSGLEPVASHNTQRRVLCTPAWVALKCFWQREGSWSGRLVMHGMVVTVARAEGVT
jgi:hypothetical protein